MFCAYETGKTFLEFLCFLPFGKPAAYKAVKPLIDFRAIKERFGIFDPCFSRNKLLLFILLGNNFLHKLMDLLNALVSHSCAPLSSPRFSLCPVQALFLASTRESLPPSSGCTQASLSLPADGGALYAQSFFHHPQPALQGRLW